MKRVIVVVVSCLCGVVLLVGAGLLFGVIRLPGGGDSARPPCEQLPNRTSVAEAVSSHEDVVTRIENVGPGVRVEVATPCGGQPDRAIVSIKYKTDSERERVDAILQQVSFGVPVELVR
jgi:hypothetical protein